jgi:hypothetical protein
VSELVELEMFVGVWWIDALNGIYPKPSRKAAGRIFPLRPVE